jgi:hypothetical protein
MHLRCAFAAVSAIPFGQTEKRTEREIEDRPVDGFRQNDQLVLQVEIPIEVHPKQVESRQGRGRFGCDLSPGFGG